VKGLFHLQSIRLESSEEVGERPRGEVERSSGGSTLSEKEIIEGVRTVAVKRI